MNDITLRAVLVAVFGLLSLLAGEATTTTPFTGVTHITRTGESPRKVTMHIVKIDLTAPGIAFQLTAPSGSRETTRQTTLEYLKQTKAQIAINGHFFVPYPSADREAFLVGFAAANGNVYSDFEIPEQSYAIVSNAPALNIDSNNQASIIDPSTSKSVQIWNAISGSAQIITNGKPSVPIYKDSSNPGGQLTAGPAAAYSNAKSWYEVPNARTVIGLSADNKTLFLFTVDRGQDSQGLKVSEAAALLAEEYGVANALNLDGGGSTTLAMQDPVTLESAIVNAPADNPKGRSVASNLAIFAKAP